MYIKFGFAVEEVPFWVVQVAVPGSGMDNSIPFGRVRNFHMVEPILKMDKELWRVFTVFGQADIRFKVANNMGSWSQRPVGLSQDLHKPPQVQPLMAKSHR